jgi:hypothetical protein
MSDFWSNEYKQELLIEFNDMRAALEEISNLDIGGDAEDVKAWQAYQFHKAQKIARCAIPGSRPTPREPDPAKAQP